MDIDDILKLDRFKGLDLFLTSEMNKYAGKEIAEKMLEIFEDEKTARDWFYTAVFSLGYERPYDYCKKAKIAEVQKELERVRKIHNNFLK